jgi:hypothetical protein
MEMSMFSAKRADRGFSGRARRPALSMVTDAQFGNWGHPLFPQNEILFLQDVYDDKELTKEWFDKATRHNVEGFRWIETIQGPRTTDGYEWEAGCRYALPQGGEAMILFPKKDDAKQSGRHCAVYTRGTTGVHMDSLRKLIEQIGHAIED